MSWAVNAHAKGRPGNAPGRAGRWHSPILYSLTCNPLNSCAVLLSACSGRAHGAPGPPTPVDGLEVARRALMAWNSG